MGFFGGWFGSRFGGWFGSRDAVETSPGEVSGLYSSPSRVYVGRFAPPHIMAEGSFEELVLGTGTVSLGSAYAWTSCELQWPAEEVLELLPPPREFVGKYVQPYPRATALFAHMAAYEAAAATAADYEGSSAPDQGTEGEYHLPARAYTGRFAATPHSVVGAASSSPHYEGTNKECGYSGTWTP